MMIKTSWGCCYHSLVSGWVSISLFSCTFLAVASETGDGKQFGKQNHVTRKRVFRLAVFFFFLLVWKKSKCVSWGHLPNNLSGSERWTRVPAVYADDVFPVATATDTFRPRSRAKHRSGSSMKINLLTLISTCQLVCCQGDCLFCFRFAISTSSAFYYSHVTVLCLYCHLLTK